MTSYIILLLVAVVVIYMIVRQFREQAITRSWYLILPLIIAYYTYTNIETELQQALISVAVLVGSLAFGLVAGLGVGALRGSFAHLRFDRQTRRAYVKTSLVSGLIWLGILGIRILALVARYQSWDRYSLLAAVFTAVGITLFLGNMLGERLSVYRRVQLLSATGSPELEMESARW